MPKVTVLYHFMRPDDVVSARLFTDLAEGLAARGWEVEARPCDRLWTGEGPALPHREEADGVSYHRVHRPALRQASPLGRLANSAWMIGAWSALGLGGPPPDAVVIGTDPMLAILAAPAIRRLAPRTKIAHWCFDLYPEAAIAEGMLKKGSAPVRILEALLRPAYDACDLVADLGPCMRELLHGYGHHARETTLTPWALVEPRAPVRPDPAVRSSLFGPARLGLLYAGTFGRAHSHEELLALARCLRHDDVAFCFGVRGNREAALRAAVGSEDTNVRFAGFAPEAELEARLGAADVTLCSLRRDFTGTVVPSKFFGSLAIGRPVVFAGSRHSSVARFIDEHQVGWVLDDAPSIEKVAGELRRLAERPEELVTLQAHCHAVYQRAFARETVIGRWDDELRRLISSKRP